MSMTDPIADLLTRIRNAYRIKRAHVDIPASNIKRRILDTLKREGYIAGYDVIEDPVQATLRVNFRYGEDGIPVFRKIDRVSKPGRRVYAGSDELKPVLRGLGITVVSTSAGVLSDREARKKGVGGEVLCKVW